MQDTQNTNEFYTIEADLIGRQNSFITKIEFHKTENKAIFHVGSVENDSSIENAKTLARRLLSLQKITDTVNQENEQSLSGFKVLYVSNHSEVEITGNLKNAFELIKEQKINKIISNCWMHDIEENSEISEIIQKSASSDSEEKTSFSSPRSGFFDTTEEKTQKISESKDSKEPTLSFSNNTDEENQKVSESKDSKGSCSGICNIL